MKPSWKTLLLLFVVAGSGMYLWHILHPPKSPLPPSGPGGTQNIGDFDAFQLSLRNRVLTQLGLHDTDSDMTAIVATTPFPVGTLLEPSRSTPANYDDCAPANMPRAFDAAHLFPRYEVSKETALTANLGSNLIQGIDSAGVNLKEASNLVYRIDDTQIQMMDRKSVDKVTGQGECGKYILANPGVRLIRGFVMGKMTFTFKVDNPASAKAQLNRIGGFSVSDDPGSSTLSVSDNSSQPVVELISTFRDASADSKAPPTPTTLEKIAPERTSTPVGVPVQAHMFVQQDGTDSPDAGTRMVEQLRAGWPKAKVESRIDKIPTEKMPTTAQVRFFNASDAQIANKCLGIVQQTYPNARAVRIGLPSPVGQLEVWLPKVKPVT